MRRRHRPSPILKAAALGALLLVAGCAPRISLGPDSADPLREFTLQGKGKEKVAVISLRGTLSHQPKKSLFRPGPSMVQEIVAQLEKAADDEAVRAIVLKVDTPGGTVTASDILYHEIAAYKEKSGSAVVAALMGKATSGGYYVSLPADAIVSHPTTVTGSVGVIFLRPKVGGLFDKIGLDMAVEKSGSLKDMGSPFRPDTEEEKRILQEMIDTLGRRFVDLVDEHRSLDGPSLEKVATARVFLAEEALSLGLVDRIGYLDDALAEAKKIAGLAEDARVVVYRRMEYPDDTLYNSTAMRAGEGMNLVDLGPAEVLGRVGAGFHYLWLPGAGGD